MIINDSQKSILGRIEHIELADFNNQQVIAKVDTGADISSIWASQIKEKKSVLSFVLFGPSSPYYTGVPISLEHKDYKLTKISNSFGAKEERYVVKLRVRVRGRLIKADFTLANRSTKNHPVLLGRRMLYKKFLVDVSHSQPLIQTEKAKHRELEQEEVVKV